MVEVRHVKILKKRRAGSDTEMSAEIQKCEHDWVVLERGRVCDVVYENRVCLKCEEINASLEIARKKQAEIDDNAMDRKNQALTIWRKHIDKIMAL